MRPTLTTLLALLFYAYPHAATETDEIQSQENLLELGDTALISGNLDTAIRYYQQGIDGIDNDSSIVTSLSLYTNIGTAHSSKGNEEQAENMYKKAILLHSQHSDDKVQKEASDLAAQATFFLGMSQQELGNYEEAANSYSRANQMDPYHWSSLANLGSVLQDHLNQPAEAILVYYKAYEILTQRGVIPTDPPEYPKHVLSQLQLRIGLAVRYAKNQKCVMYNDPEKEVSCSEMAASAFNTAIALDPNNEEAKHMLASITADATMSRASNTYVTDLFERYAENFEHSLVEELGYDGYERLRRAFDRAFGGADKVPTFEYVIDGGCGTGLAGEQFRNVSDYLVGIDLSPSIIEKAEKSRPNLYNETKVGDFVEIFGGNNLKHPISLIIAADSFIYFGDLSPLFQSMKQGLADGGIVTFTLENVAEDDEKVLNEVNPTWRWKLTPSGRFAHRREYVASVAKENMLHILLYEPMDGFRKEGASEVRGHIFVMVKQANTEL